MVSFNALFARDFMESETIDNTIVGFVSPFFWGFSVHPAACKTRAREMFRQWRVNG